LEGGVVGEEEEGKKERGRGGVDYMYSCLGGESEKEKSEGNLGFKVLIL
jgi:hypothetical protein